MTLAHSLSYESILPEQVGRQRSFYLGKFAGRHLTEYVLRKNDVTATPDQIEAIAQAIKQYHAAQEKTHILARFDKCKADFAKLKTDLTEEDLLAIAKGIIAEKKKNH